jgi:hypothetical protein
VKEKIITLIKKSWNASEKAYETLFKDPDNREQQLIAAHFINKAVSFICTAQAIYYSNYNAVKDESIEEVFKKFDEFETEFSLDLSTGLFHRWTNLPYEEFKESMASLLEDYAVRE